MSGIAIKIDACEHLSGQLAAEGFDVKVDVAGHRTGFTADVPLFPQPQPQPHSENKRMIMRIRIQLLQQPMFLTSFRLTLTLYGKRECW